MEVILLSKRSAAVYQSFGLRRPVTVIPKFTSKDGFEPDAELGQFWVYIGRLTEEKGVVQLVQNWPPGQKLRIYGDGPAADDARSHASSDITFAGAVPRSEIPGILAASQGMIFPSLWFEGAPMTYVEALAAGRPVVAKMGNGVADDVMKSGAGAVFDDWEEFERSLDAVATQGRDAGQRARQHFDQTYSLDSWVASIESVYEDVAR